MDQPTQEKTPSYKQTLNLPATGFSMKANLVQHEPASMKRWDRADLYAKVQAARGEDPRFVFHDGPPYANGDIHLGHLLNKVLKDFVVRSKSMAGHEVPYVPGWDCHGLPIEHKVLQDLGEKAKDMSPLDIRRQCRKAAQKYVKLQSRQMRRLLTLADYEDPYLTMNPRYEAAVLEVFARMLERGVVYRGLKPVHWSIDNQTALAEAELEYHDREDTSVYVLLDVIHEDANAPAAAKNIDQLMVWTTTPWTLPANRAVAVHAQLDYGVYELGGKRVALATERAAQVLEKEGIEPAAPASRHRGADLIGITYQHPFLDDQVQRPVVAADYVTLQEGTGLVHTAPGHGTEDYQTGLHEGLEIYCPVRADGTFDATTPDWLQGQSVWEANDLVLQRLDQSGHLFHREAYAHSYPHDWRSKTPVIFRATAQWFVEVNKPMAPAREARAAGGAEGAEAAGGGGSGSASEAGSKGGGGIDGGAAGGGDPELSIREGALRVTGEEAMKFYPAWGRQRMRGMLDTRPDWCLSRQRAWGLPIPAFYCSQEDHPPLLTAASVRAVAKVIEEKGSDAWFVADPADLLQHYDPAADPDAPAWVGPDAWADLQKSTDIFDVWFESGSSWHAVLRQRGLARPEGAPAWADLYLEGSDQHRGWFQLSLLASLAATGKPAFGGVLTHGFMVDRQGRKMSKSQGNALGVESLLKNHGADVCRWWVASTPTDNDIKVDPEFFDQAGESYRKVRNTIRFVLGNLGDFDPARHEHEFTDADAASLDAWVLGELSGLVGRVRKAYAGYDFRRAHELMFNFCNHTLSAVYLAAVKDRLYCDSAQGPGSARRRRSQTALHRIASAVIRLLAPLMPHTADEAWRELTGEAGEEACVHLQRLPDPAHTFADPVWDQVIQAREDHWLKAIETFRQAHDIDNPMDLGLSVNLPEPMLGLDPTDLADLCGISRFDPTPGKSPGKSPGKPPEKSPGKASAKAAGKVAAKVTARAGGKPAGKPGGKPGGKSGGKSGGKGSAQRCEIADLRQAPRCDRCWKRTAGVAKRSDGGVLCKRCAKALGL